MRSLIVGGTFDDSNGKASKIIEKLALQLNWPSINGGNLSRLKNINFLNYDVLIWMPNIDNSEDKILPTIKKINQKLFLIQSKRVRDSSFTDNDMVGRLLSSHSALGIMIKQDSQIYNFRVLDPLGNLWCYTSDLGLLAEMLNKRINQVLQMKRINSIRVGDKIDFEIDPEFIKIIQNYGNQFTNFVNAVNPNRLLGNASTRCSRGFPGIRIDNHLFVTRRNVDKQTLSTSDFVRIENTEGSVRYYGDAKPSVDTPIQIRLFNYYSNVNYMLHGHVYVKDGIMTDSKIPCGFLDEFDEITHIVKNRNSSNFIMNLRGHGCLIMANNLDFFKNQELVGRPFPEE